MKSSWQSNSFLAISSQSPSTAICRIRSTSLPTTVSYSLLLCCFYCSSRQSQSCVTNRRSVGQSVLHYDQIFISVRQLRVCWCGAFSLTRERVCRLQLLLDLANAVILGSESRGNRDHILLSQIRDSPNLEGQVPVFISPRNRVAQLYPQALGSLFVASYDSQGYGGGIRTRLHAGSLKTLLTGLGYNTSARTAYKNLFHYCFSLAAVETSLFAEPLLSNGCRIVACCAVVA
jgi:hypothetical protein